MLGSTSSPPASRAASACLMPAVEFVARTSIAVGITKYGHALDFGAADGPATVILLIATPASSFWTTLRFMTTLAPSLSKESFRR